MSGERARQVFSFRCILKCEVIQPTCSDMPQLSTTLKYLISSSVLINVARYARHQYIEQASLELLTPEQLEEKRLRNRESAELKTTSAKLDQLLASQAASEASQAASQAYLAQGVASQRDKLTEKDSKVAEQDSKLTKQDPTTRAVAEYFDTIRTRFFNTYLRNNNKGKVSAAEIYRQGDVGNNSLAHNGAIQLDKADHQAGDSKHNKSDKTKIDKTKILGFEPDVYDIW